MNILTAIGGLESLLDELFEEKPVGLDFSEQEYEDEIRHLFEQQTKSVQDNLDRVIERSSKEDITAARNRFFHNIELVQRRLELLKDRVRRSSLSLNSKIDRKAVQLRFCERTLSFIDTIDSQLKELDEEALSQAEINDTYFIVILPSKEELAVIYTNLVKEHWIEGDDTSFGDFSHFFGGEGLKPRHRIKWNKSLSILAAFIDLMTDDKNAISKAAKVFSICDDKDKSYRSISRDSLKQRRYKALNEGDAPFFTYQETIRREIFGLTK